MPEMSMRNDRIAALPTPRLQLRWMTPTDEDVRDYPCSLGSGPSAHRVWVCHYELVLPLSEYDIRRENADGSKDDVLIVHMGKTRCGSTNPPVDVPYRDGSHALWDSSALGGLPVYVITIDGVARPHVSKERLSALLAQETTHAE